MLVWKSAHLRVVKICVKHNDGEGENVHSVGAVEYLMRWGRLHVQNSGARVRIYTIQGAPHTP
jgi:hypothetical protein